ncbi:MAG TPA: FtsX-like permease family protein, partial [Candidatus Limnocylindrales bacterium]|nr:FtsX-like permease family protein [Candidatus Limnocylindrales bacterium]
MTLGSSRSLLRLARRNVGRSRWRSLLIVILVLLPVAGMAGAATVLRTVTPAAEREVVGRMGRADLLVSPGSGGTEALLRDHLPAGSRIEPFLNTGDSLILPGIRLPVTVSSLDPTGLARGMLALVGGRFPATSGEVAISAEVGRLAKVGLGDHIQVGDLGSLAVVGLVENPLALKERLVLADPSLAAAGVASEASSWLVGLPAGTDPTTIDYGGPVAQMGSGYSPASAPVFIVTTRATAFGQSSPTSPTLIVLGGLALVDAALVAAAAFAVGVRRRQRELGLLAASGAEPRHLAATVLAEAGVLGLIASAGGVAIGLLGALAMSPFLDDLSGHRNPAITLDPVLLVVAAALGIAASVGAALAPAWRAGRMPVLRALSGRRPPERTGRRSLSLGGAIVGFALAMTITGSAVRFGGGDTTISTLLLLGGAVLGTLGFGTLAPWLLEQLERPSRHLPLAPRLALRDTARARARSGPIVTALLAAFAATVALSAYQASVEASNLARFQPPVQPEQIQVEGPGAATAGAAIARELEAAAAGAVRGAGSDTQLVWISPRGSNDPNAPLSTQYVTVGDVELLRALGGESAVTAFEAGSVVLFSNNPSGISQATVHIDAPNGIPSRTADVPAVVVLRIATGNLPGAVLPGSVAERLGIPAGANEQNYVMRLAHPATDADLGTAARIAAGYADTFITTARPPDVAGGAFRWVIIGLSLLFALTVTGIAV